MNILIVGGGEIDLDFTREYYKYIYEPTLHVIACDKGFEACQQLGIASNVIIGDFDSVDDMSFEKARETGAEIIRLNPVKNDTDVEAALELAFDLTLPEKDIIYMLGCTGKRMDHFLGNIHLLGMGIKKGRCIKLVDRYNIIEILGPKDEYVVEPESQFGKYISVFPFMGPVTGLTMSGFKYPLEDYTLEGFNTLTVSNELSYDIKNGDYAKIFIESGYLIVMETRD